MRFNPEDDSVLIHGKGTSGMRYTTPKNEGQMS
jgi:hypothetical protein